MHYYSLAILSAVEAALVEKKKLLYSATPTPLDENWKVDRARIAPLLEFQLHAGVDGFFVGGTCGEGPWLARAELAILWREFAQASAGRIPILAQVTDNSAARILESIDAAAEAGVDAAVVAEPYFHPNARVLTGLYREVLEKSALPVVIYCRGEHANVKISDEVFTDLLADTRVAGIKDSSSSPVKRALVLEAKRRRPELIAWAGDENQCLAYLSAGYDGVMVGGAAFSAPLLRDMIEALGEGDLHRAEALDEQIRARNLTVYGEGFKSWMVGLKYFLVRQGLSATTNHHLQLDLPLELMKNIDALIHSSRSK